MGERKGAVVVKQALNFVHAQYQQITILLRKKSH